jgi:hypothetical protein
MTIGRGDISATEQRVETFSGSIGASPVAAQARVPWRGQVTKVGCVTAGAITVANASVQVAINGTNLVGAVITVLQSGAAAGQHFSATGSWSGGQVKEDDVITFTPSGASGANIPAHFYACVKKG